MDFVFFSCCFCFLHCCYSHEPPQWSCCFWHRNYHGESWNSELYNKVTNISSTQTKASQKLPGLKQSHTWRVFCLEILLISCLSGLQSHSWPRFPAWLSVIRYVSYKTYHIWNYLSFFCQRNIFKAKKGIIFLSKCSIALCSTLTTDNNNCQVYSHCPSARQAGHAVTGATGILLFYRSETALSHK